MAFETMATYEPHDRLLWAYEYWGSNSTHSSSRWGGVGDIITYRVPMPYVRFKAKQFHRDTRRVTHVDFSHDGKNWMAAYLPHCYGGEISGCCLAGDHSYDNNDVAANLFDYTISYIYNPTFKWWHKLWPSIERQGMYNDPKPFLETWEQTPMPDILDYLHKQAS